MRRAAVVISACSAPLLAANTYVTGIDIRPEVTANKIVPQAFDDATSAEIANVRHFGWQFQKDAADPYFLQDPGFNAPAASGLPASSQLSFRVLRSLYYWDGTGRVNFNHAPPASEAVKFALGPVLATTINGTSGAQNGFTFGTVATNGSIHRHISSYLLGSDGNAAAGDGVVATNGMYLTNIQLFTSNSSPVASDSLYLAFNDGLSDAKFAAAMNYIANPLPGDANFDGTVDTLDFAGMLGGFGKSTPQYFYNGDFNNDYTVNSIDFNLLTSNYGATAPVPAVLPGALAPEPGSFALIVLASAGMRRAGRRSFVREERENAVI